jgi:hypothetical protein
MKDELRIYCRLEGFDEEYLRARFEADRRILRPEKKRKAESACAGRKCGSPESLEEPEEN